MAEIFCDEEIWEQKTFTNGRGNDLFMCSIDRGRPEITCAAFLQNKAPKVGPNDGYWP